MQKLKFTIVTPSYNQGRFIEQTICSVLSQDYSEVEYIVMDGGSTDDSVGVIEKYSHRLFHWTSQKDGGQSDAIAKGFSLGSGDIYCWLNSDDVLLPGALSAVAKHFESNPCSEVLSCGAYCIDANGAPVKKFFGNYTLGIRASYDRLRFYEQDGVFQPSTFWRRAPYEEVGGVDPSLQFIMDRDLFLRMSRRRRFDRLPLILACFRVHDEGKSSKIQHVRENEMAEFSRRYGLTEHNKIFRAVAYYRFRIPSFLRKAWLALRLFTGNVKLKRLN